MCTVFETRFRTCQVVLNRRGERSRVAVREGRAPFALVLIEEQDDSAPASAAAS